MRNIVKIYLDLAVKTFPLFLALTNIFNANISLVSESKIGQFFYPYYSASPFFTN